MQVYAVLNSLPSSWDSAVTSINCLVKDLSMDNFSYCVCTWWGGKKAL